MQKSWAHTGSFSYKWFPFPQSHPKDSAAKTPWRRRCCCHHLLIWLCPSARRGHSSDWGCCTGSWSFGEECWPPQPRDWNPAPTRQSLLWLPPPFSVDALCPFHKDDKQELSKQCDWHIYAVEYYSALKKNKILVPAATGLNWLYVKRKKPDTKDPPYHLTPFTWNV